MNHRTFTAFLAATSTIPALVASYTPCAAAEQVQPAIELVSRVTVIIIIFTACIKLAINELPVPALLVLVVSKRNASTEILDLYGKIAELTNNYLIAVTFSCLVNRVGKYLKERMLATDKVIRAKYYGRSFSYSVGTLKAFYTLIVIISFLFNSHTYPTIILSF